MTGRNQPAGLVAEEAEQAVVEVEVVGVAKQDVEVVMV